MSKVSRDIIKKKASYNGSEPFTDRVKNQITAQEKKMKDLHEMYKETSQEEVILQQRDEKFRNKKISQVDFEQQYNRTLAKQGEKRMKLELEKERQLQEEIDQCTFQPKARLRVAPNSTSPNISGKYSTSSPGLMQQP